jgi:hypothetical protein
MPAGGTTLGLVYFGAVKLAGYTAAAGFLRRHFPENRTPLIIPGAVRTVIGIVAGVGAVFLAGSLGSGRSEAFFYLLLAPIRILEWLLLIWLFYRKPKWEPGRALRFAALGALWSYVLDLPAVFAMFVIPGGAWIC